MSKESKVEVRQARGPPSPRHHRGELARRRQPFRGDDVTLLKFHGTYQQDDRDARKRRDESAEKAFSFMVRVALPAGALDADQYLALEEVADRHANGTLRVTTRQGFQFHGVLKGDLKATIAEVNHQLLTTLAACGDVYRNVMGCPAPLDDECTRPCAPPREASPSSSVPARGPTTRSGSTARSRSRPRRRSRSTATCTCRGSSRPASPSRSTTAWTSGPRTWAWWRSSNGRTIRGFNLLVGGGLGMTHHKADTTARLAQPLGFVPTEHAVEAVRIVAAIFRDHGNRADRRHARLKYLLAEWGIERFRAEFAAAGGVPARAAGRAPVAALSRPPGPPPPARRPLVLRRLRPERPDHRHRRPAAQDGAARDRHPAPARRAAHRAAEPAAHRSRRRRA